MIYADTSLPVFFGDEGGVLSGRLDRSKGKEESIVTPVSKTWDYRKRHFFCQKCLLNQRLEQTI